MKVEKSILTKSMWLIFGTVIAYLMIAFSNQIYIHIIAFLIVCAIAIIEVKFDLLHPYFWFSAFFCLYSIGYPLIIAMGFKSNVGYSKEIMIYQLIALLVALLVITPRNYQMIKTDESTEAGLTIDIGVFNRIIYMILIALIIIGALYVSRSGFSGKDDIYASGSSILKAIFRMPLIISLLYAMSVVSNYKQTQKFPIKQFLITMISLLVITLFSGERDFVFRFLIINIFILWYVGKLRLFHLGILGPAFVAIIPLSSAYKYYFLSGASSVVNNNIVYSFLSGEFESSARNLQMLVNHSNDTIGVKGIGLLFTDILGVFSSKVESSVSWFNQTFYPTSKTQYGFSLVGEGYIVGGIIGIIIVFIIVGLLVKIMYKNAFKSIYSISAYLYFITVMIYSMRGDLGTIYAALVKQMGLVILILYLAQRFSVSNKSHR